jgi:hypothetical protein
LATVGFVEFVTELDFERFELRQNRAAQALLELGARGIADREILQLLFESSGIASDLRIVTIRLPDGLEVALCIADDLARVHRGQIAIVDAFRVVPAVAIVTAGVGATVVASATVLVTAALATLGLLLATLLTATALLATLLAALLLAALLATLLALALLLATLLLTALLAALSLLLATLLTVLARLLPLALLALLATLLTALSGLLLQQPIQLCAQVLNGGHLTFLFVLAGGLTLAVAHFALSVADGLLQLIQALAEPLFLAEPPLEIGLLAAADVVTGVVDAFPQLRLLGIGQPFAELAGGIRIALAQLLRLALDVAFQLLVILAHLFALGEHLLALLLAGATLLPGSLL